MNDSNLQALVDLAGRQAREIVGLVQMVMFDEAESLLRIADKADVRVLRAALACHLAVENWDAVIQVSGRLLATPGGGTWEDAVDAALALHHTGQSAAAYRVHNTYFPNPSSSFEMTAHHYGSACYLSAMGFYKAALYQLLAAFTADRFFWSKAFVDSDLRSLWQWLGDQTEFDEDLRSWLDQSGWLKVLGVVNSTEARFILDFRDLKLYPTWRAAAAWLNDTTTIVVYRPSVSAERFIALRSWLQGRSRWAARRLRKAIRGVRKDEVDFAMCS